MATETPLTPEHAREYHRLTQSGHAPGKDTLALARGNVAKAATVEAAGGGPEDPVADVAAASQLLGSAKSRSNSTNTAAAGSLASNAYRKMSSPSAASQTLTRIIWAVALGLIVLEVASEATGQFWDFKLNGPALNKQPYVPLYAGQNLNQSPAPALAIGPAIVSNQSLSNRSGGNQALP